MFKQPQITSVKRPNPFIIAGISIIMIIAVALAAWLFVKSKPAQSDVKPPVTQASSMFWFDKTGALDWRQGPTNSTSMAMFYDKGDCFVSIDQQKGSIDETEQVSNAIATMQSQGNQNVTAVTVPLQLATTAGAIPYTLHQYRATGGPSDYYQFQEAAYIQNDAGYLHISGYCKDGNNLDATLNALRAISVRKQ